MAKFNDIEGLQFECELDIHDASVAARATGDSGPLLVQEYVSAAVAFGDLGSGTSDTIALTGFPANAVLLGAAIEVDTAFTVGGGDTTGLTVSLGDAGDPDGALLALDLVGVSAGLSPHLAGAQLGQAEAAWAPILTFTATGGSEELDHVDAGALKVHIYYAAIGLAD